MAELPSLQHYPDAESPSANPREAASPLISVTSVTRRGLVLFSRRNLEVGSHLHVGLHVRLKGADGRGSHSHFMEVHGFVVHSCLHSPRGSTLFEITLLYDRMSTDHRHLLASVPLDAIKATAHNALSEHEAFLFGERPRSVIGLN